MYDGQMERGENRNDQEQVRQVGRAAEGSNEEEDNPGAESGRKAQ